MKRKSVCVVIALTLMGWIGQTVLAQDAAEVLRRADQVMFAPKDQKTVTSIILIDKSGNERVRKAIMLQKGMDMRLTRFTEPAAQAGIGFLSLPGDIMYIYLPAFGKERRIATHVRNQNFAGTDFTYDDMEAKPYSEKYDPVSLNTSGNDYLLELVPKPEFKSDYSKLVFTTDKTNGYVKKIEFFNRGGVRVKVMENRVEKRQGYWATVEVVMKDLTRDHTTRMIVEEVIFDSNLSDDEFTVRKLKQ